MKKNLKLLVSSALVALTFSTPQKIWGMEENQTLSTQKHQNSCTTQTDDISQNDPTLYNQKPTESKKRIEELKVLVEAMEKGETETEKQIESLKDQLAQAEEERISLKGIVLNLQSKLGAVTDEAEKVRKAAQEAEHQNRHAIIAIRESMIDDSINLYKLLGTSNITPEYLKELLEQSKMRFYVAENEIMNGKFINASTSVLHGIRLVGGRHDSTFNSLGRQENLLKPAGYGMRLSSNPTIQDIKDVQTSVKYIIKEDVFQTMQLYNELHGKPHPRMDEFRNMQNP